MAHCFVHPKLTTCEIDHKTKRPGWDQKTIYLMTIAICLLNSVRDQPNIEPISGLNHYVSGDPST